MSKPLELKTFELRSVNGVLYADVPLGEAGEVTTVNVDQVVQEKRLTEAEGASESYRQLVRATRETGMYYNSETEECMPMGFDVFGPFTPECARMEQVVRIARHSSAF